MLSSATITTNNAPALAAQCVRPGNATNYVATVYIQGTFDSATVELYLSIDGGATLIPLNDSSGNPITAMANDVLLLNLGGGQISTPEAPLEQLWAKATGGGGSLNVAVKVNSNG